MTNLPYKVGDRYRCFTVSKRERGWGGAYGQVWRGVEWTCEHCGYVVKGQDSWSLARMADHHGCGHAPCAYCGKLLLRRMDGSPRQHPHNKCPGKAAGHKIEQEFVMNMTGRDYR